MAHKDLRQQLKIVYLFIVLHFILFIPKIIRELFVIFLSFALNPLFRSLGLVYFLIQRLFNSLLVFLAYYLGIGFSALFSKLAGKDYLNLRYKNKPTFWIKKEEPGKGAQALTRQF